ncbi:exonuclease SbcCD subunit D [Azoarcus indigens]|uniref:Nuclease SbcCD subunit D n=1 Tax=Azoarcus indigens TaxID=29545 RepID=A0A4R6DLD3_9RHOO|nr:exonuclease SbcCD subunit D [Azoarcus indigens]TDN45590.1 exodeoxyribonuclease I subunit D [Azoarcus indigens]
MRFLHTADWHLGRVYHGMPLLEDQAHVLRDFVRLAAELKPDAILIAGDVYDRSVPPADAVKLLDEVLAELVLGLGLRVAMIAGNHDGPDRLAFGSGLLARAGLTVRGPVEAGAEPLLFDDAHGKVAVHLLPYGEPALVRAALPLAPAIAVKAAAQGTQPKGRPAMGQPAMGQPVMSQGELFPSAEAAPDLANQANPVDPAESSAPSEAAAPRIADHHSALAAQVAAARARQPAGARSVAVAHAFVIGGSEAESERPLTVGGSGSVGAELFDGFDYAALGHLHRPQQIGSPRIQYSGSLLKYSFAEADHAKSVSLVTLGAPGELQVERIALAPRRDLRILEGRLDELLAAAASDPARQDYVLARLSDDGALLDAMGKLRTAYPNALAIERSLLQGEGGAHRGGDHRRMRVEDLFAGFYREMTGQALGEGAAAVLAEVVQRVEREARQA